MSNNKHKRDQIIQNTRKETATVIPEVSYKHKVKQQTFFDKYRTKLLTAAAVLTFATPAAITAVQDGNFNPLAAIQAESGDDVSKEITGLEMKLVNSDGSDINDSKVNPYRQYNLYLKTQSNITIGSGRIEVGDFFYINVPEELDYTAVQQMVADTNDFKYSIKVVEKDGQKQLRVEINDIMNLPINAFETEMTLPVKFADTINQEVTLTASTQGATSNEQTVIIQSREKSDISNQTDVALKVVEMTDGDAENFSEITSAVDPATVLGLQLSFTFNTDDLMPGDTFTVELPKELEYVDGAAVNIARPEMQVAGKINGNDKTATFTVIRVPKGTGQAEAMKTTVAAPFDLLEIPINGGEVTLTATTAKNSASQKITISQASVSRDVTASVKNLTFDLTDEDGETVAQNAEVNPYKVYGMNINVDMGENAGVQQLKAGDYIDLILPSYMDYSYITDEMINDSPTLKSVGKIIDINGQKVLRTTIKQVARGVSSTVTFGFKLSVPFDLEQLYNINEEGVWRKFTLTLKPTKGKGGRSLDLYIKNLGNPEVPNNSGEYASPHNRLFYQANFTDVLRAEYISSEFWQHSRKKLDNGEIADRGLYPYSVYTLVKVERSTLPRHDYLANNVDPTKKHWSAAPGHPSEPNDSPIPNAGPGNYVNGYCISAEPFTFTTPTAIAAPKDDTPRYGNQQKYVGFKWREYRYNKKQFDHYFESSKIGKELNTEYRNKLINALKSIISHSYPFVSEEVMRQYFGFDIDIHLSDMLAATQQIIWNTLGIDPMFEPNSTSVSSIEEPVYDPERYTIALTDSQKSIASYPKDQNVVKALKQMQAKRYNTYNNEAPKDVKIVSSEWSEVKDYVTVTLSRQLDSSETGRLIVSAPGKKAQIKKLDTTNVAYSVDVSNLIDNSIEKNHIDITLDITDNDANVEFYAYEDSADAQDIISCEMNPRKYSDQASLEFETPKEKPKGEFEFLKLEAGTQVTIEGAEFTLTKVTSKTEATETDEVYTAVGGTDGKVVFTGLPEGFYLLKETKAPEGYMTINKQYLVQIRNGDEAVLYDKYGENWGSMPKPGSGIYTIKDPIVEIELIKSDESDETKKLPDAIFELDKVDADGKSNGQLEGYPKRYTTDKDGKIVIKHLTNGSYTMKEVKAPEGYQLSAEVKTFTIVKGEVSLIDKDGTVKKLQQAVEGKLDTYTNNPIPYTNKLAEIPNLTIKKVSSEDANTFLSGAEFTITNLATKKPVETVTTNGNGEVTFKKLSPGYYSIKETKAPDGYKLSDKEWVIYVDNDGHHYEVNKKGSVTVPVAGSELTLIKSDNYQLVDYTTVTGAFDGNPDTFTLLDDTSNWKDTLHVGEYVGAKFNDGKSHHITKIHIKQAPTAHPNDFYSKYEIQYLNENNEWVKFENKEYTDKEITIETDIHAKQICIVNLEEKAKSWIGLQTFELEEQASGSNAEFKSTVGTAPDELLNTASKIMSIDTKNKTYTQYVYLNNYKNSPVYFNTKFFQPHAIIDVPEGNTMDTISYELIEVPKANVINTLRSFDSDLSSYTKLNKANVPVTLANNQLKFDLRDDLWYGQGIVVAITAKYDIGMEQQVTNLDLESTFAYYPKSWSWDKNTATTHNTATIVNYGKGDPITGPIIVENTPSYDLKIKKTNNEGKELEGATFILTTESGKEVIKKISNSAGDIIFDGLEPGNYILEETSAPLGYVPTAKKWHITVEEDGTIKYKPVMDNEQKGKSYVTEEGSFVKKYQDPGYKCYMLNLASKIIAVDPKAKTFTQYVYVNNWFNSDNNSDAVIFDRAAFRPKVSLKLPKGKITNTKVDVYRVPWYNVGELTDFDLDLTHFEKIKENTDSERGPDEIDIKLIDGKEIKPNMIDIKFGTALAKPITYKGKVFKSNAAVIAVTSTYEGNAITTTSSFQYNNINAFSNELLAVRKVSTTSSAYEFSTEEQSGAVITQPIEVANDKDEIPEPEKGKGQVLLKKTVVGVQTAGAEFTLYEGRLESLGDVVGDPIVSDKDGVVVFNNIPSGVYTLKETKAPDGAVKTERTWTVIVSEDGYTEAIENPIEGGSAKLTKGGINQAENMIVENQSFTMYPKGNSDGTVVTEDSQSTIYPNNGGLMNLKFEADFKENIKPQEGDYFIVDIPDYMHDHGINPADRNQHILQNANSESIAIGKMMDIVEVGNKEYEVLTKENGQKYYLVDSKKEGQKPIEKLLKNAKTNRVIKYTFTKYASRMDSVVLYGDMMLSIDTDIVTENIDSKEINYTVAGKQTVKAGTLDVRYPKGGNNEVVSINSAINYKDNLNQEFEYYIYLNPDRIKDPNNIKLSIYDFGLSVNNEVLTSGYDSVADIQNIEFYKVPKEETLPASFGIRHNLPKEKITPTAPEKWLWHKVGNEKRYSLGNLFKDGDSYVVKVTGTMGLQGDSLALSARLTSDANPYEYLNINNWTYLRSNGGGISGELSDRYPVLDIANAPVNKAKIKITKIDAKTDNPIGFGDFDSARFAITTKPNPVSTNNGQNSDDIYNGQVANLIGNKGSSFTFENSDKQGFEPGQYYLWEMRAPKGYAKLLDVIPFYIEEDGSIIIPSKEIKQGDMVVGHEVDTEHFAYDMITQPTKVDDTPIFEIKVKNRKVEYPKTGSIGSMIFYMIGLTGVIGSAWMLTKKQ